MDAKTMMNLITKAKRSALDEMPQLEALSVERGAIAMFGELMAHRPLRDRLKDLVEDYSRRYDDGGIESLKADLKEFNNPTSDKPVKANNGVD